MSPAEIDRPELFRRLPSRSRRALTFEPANREFHVMPVGVARHANAAIVGFLPNFPATIGANHGHARCRGPLRRLGADHGGSFEGRRRYHKLMKDGSAWPRPQAHPLMVAQRILPIEVLLFMDEANVRGDEQNRMTRS